MEGKHAKKSLTTAISAPASTLPMDNTLSETTRPKQDTLFFDRVSPFLVRQALPPTTTKAALQALCHVEVALCQEWAMSAALLHKFCRGQLSRLHSGEAWQRPAVWHTCGMA